MPAGWWRNSWSPGLRIFVLATQNWLLLRGWAWRQNGLPTKVRWRTRKQTLSFLSICRSTSFSRSTKMNMRRSFRLKEKHSLSVGISLRRTQKRQSWKLQRLKQNRRALMKLKLKRQKINQRLRKLKNQLRKNSNKLKCSQSKRTIFPNLLNLWRWSTRK